MNIPTPMSAWKEYRRPRPKDPEPADVTVGAYMVTYKIVEDTYLSVEQINYLIL